MADGQISEGLEGLKIGRDSLIFLSYTFETVVQDVVVMGFAAVATFVPK